MSFVVNKVTVQYVQDADSNSCNSEQFIELSTEDAGGGQYYVLKTERWAFDSPDELMELLNDFKSRSKTN